VPVVCVSPPSPRAAVALPAAPRAQRGRDWIGLVASLAAGSLLGHLVLAALRQEPVGTLVLQAVGAVAAVWFVLRRRAKLAREAPATVAPPAPEPPPLVRDQDLDRGVRDIRRTDRGFDAARFAGYAAMTFRDVQSAGMARDASALRDRVTPAMYVELAARGHRLRASGQSTPVTAVDVTAEVTEAWQDGDRDYVTACVAGSMQSHTVDEATGRVVDGSPALPVPVEAFLTFTRPAGLNFWMLSLIQEK
jgi:predicted lipid-binding transport protein (Tim44 family)